MAEPCSERLADCGRCPRLVALRHQVREALPDYHAAPVPAWGRTDARLLIVGLAPGMHGANRTGKPFSGDSSGDFLFQALYRAGLSSEPRADDARLLGVRITNAVKCLPPGNRPFAAEVTACSGFLTEELASLVGQYPRRSRCVLCLGRQAHDALARVLRNDPVPGFSHGCCTQLREKLFLVDSYHPSRLNTQTGRLTADMLDRVLQDVVGILASRP